MRTLEPDLDATSAGWAGLAGEAEIAGRTVSRPALYRRLDASGRVTWIAAAAGSGKTMLVRSWLAESGRARDAAWVTVGCQGHDPRRFWTMVTDALRGTATGLALVRPVTGQSVCGSPVSQGRVMVERLLSDLAPLDSPLWLVIDDLHELGPETLRQLEAVISRAPSKLRFVLASRDGTPLELRGPRADGDLTEIRDADLRLTPDEARELLRTEGVWLAGPEIAGLLARVQGRPAGLRQAAWSLASGEPRSNTGS